jgi:hypothetical protein
LEHNNEALLFSFTHSSEKENESLLVNEHLKHTYTLKQPRSHKDQRERERERESIHPQISPVCYKLRALLGFAKPQKTQRRLNPKTQNTTSPKNKNNKRM